MPKSRMSMISVVFLVLWAAGVFLILTGAWEDSPRMRLLSGLLPLLLAIPAGYGVYRLFKYAKTSFFWKISRRLIFTHIFIGAIPIIAVIGIFYVSSILFYYQFSYFLISNQIGIHSVRIHAFNNLALREGLRQLMLESPKFSPEILQEILDAESRYILSEYPSASIVLCFTNPATGQSSAYINQHSVAVRLENHNIPEWVKQRGEFNGLIVENERARGGVSRLLLRSFVSSDFPSEFPFSIEVTVPFDSYMIGMLKTALGQDLLLARQSGQSGLRMVLPLTNIPSGNVLESTFHLEDSPAVTRWMWPIPLFPTSWDDGEEMSPARTDTLMVEASLPKLLRSFLRSDSVVGQRVYQIFAVIVAIFLLAEVISIVIGILLTRSVTQAVHNLDLGTQFVKRGDFSHRIVLRSRDQLGALAESFNQMTEYVQQLVKERVLKERLEHEIEIAREVQERLFPARAPKMKRLDIAGVCLPARTVSGDYYDFLSMGADELGVAVGDISGKGISAALLMASLQATLRSSVTCSRQEPGEEYENGVAGLVERINKQIYGFTTDDRFATFFYARYDGVERTITYCNAGHNPPLHFSGETYRRLSVGGTVIGLFPNAGYAQETMSFNDGDLLVAYTDGITECLNASGEEFGEERLIQLIQPNRDMSAEDLKEYILENVQSWKLDREQDDDMTLIIIKMNAN